uniref:Uncharacterized protein n=1 Tax=Siphoviridae sp. ctbrg2 TaxID=2823589 RepID=A0A8S5LGA0_9CAUD|nr:MAG TPA: hypothetical protein [Siphoviridae sp. ctbrg2]
MEEFLFVKLVYYDYLYSTIKNNKSNQKQNLWKQEQISE